MKNEKPTIFYSLEINYHIPNNSWFNKLCKSYYSIISLYDFFFS